jgi:hypothetical protein
MSITTHRPKAAGLLPFFSLESTSDVADSGRAPQLRQYLATSGLPDISRTQVCWAIVGPSSTLSTGVSLLSPLRVPGCRR